MMRHFGSLWPSVWCGWRPSSGSLSSCTGSVAPDVRADRKLQTPISEQRRGPSTLPAPPLATQQPLVLKKTHTHTYIGAWMPLAAHRCKIKLCFWLKCGFLLQNLVKVFIPFALCHILSSCNQLWSYFFGILCIGLKQKCCTAASKCSIKGRAVVA